MADMTPVFKREDLLDQTNYGPTTFSKQISFVSALWIQEMVWCSICPYKSPKLTKVF